MNTGIKKSICVVILSICSFLALTGCISTRFYTNEQHHLERVTKLAKERYIDNGDFTGLQVYPLYNDNDELEYFLIDLEPWGHVYVCIQEYKTISQNSMYRRSHPEPADNDWQRYRLCKDGQEPEPYEGIPWKAKVGEFGNILEPNKRWEVDEKGDFIYYYDSPFKIANIQDEKRYLLRINKSNYVIPAVKRDNKYFNLISMEEIEYKQIKEEKDTPNIHVGFIPKDMFDL